MGKKLLFILLAGLMLVPTGCGQQDKTALPKVQSEQTASSKLNPSEPVIDGENKVYTLGGIEIPFPLEHLDKMIVITDFPKERSDGETLLEAYEKASVEALKKTSSSEDGGFLFGFNVMNQAQFEQLLANDVGGCSVFARKGDNYYAKLNIPIEKATITINPAKTCLLESCLLAFPILSTLSAQIISNSQNFPVPTILKTLQQKNST